MREVMAYVHSRPNSITTEGVILTAAFFIISFTCPNSITTEGVILMRQTHRRFNESRPNSITTEGVILTAKARLLPKVRSKFNNY